MDKNYKPKLQAIKDLIKKRPNDYLRMLRKTEILLSISLGNKYNETIRPQGILNEVFSDLIDGTRAWDMEKLSLDQVVFMNIRSEVSCLAKKERRFTTYEENTDEENENSINKLDNIIYTEPPDIEGEMDAKAMQDFIFNEILKEDDEGGLVLIEMLEGFTQKEIAEKLGTTVDKTEVHIRRVRRKIISHLNNGLFENIPRSILSKILKN